VVSGQGEDVGTKVVESRGTRAESICCEAKKNLEKLSGEGRGEIRESSMIEE